MNDFVKQKRKNESAPVALLNLGKKLDISTSYQKYIERFRELCNIVDPKDIINWNDFDVAVRSIYGWMTDIVLIRQPTMGVLARSIKDYDAVILRFRRPNDNMDHFMLVSNEFDGNFTVINLSRLKPTHHRLNEDGMREIFTRCDSLMIWAVNSKL